MKKLVGLGKDRDYNLEVMCYRISPTGFATRTIAGLYIFLATFLIGYIVVRSVSWTPKRNADRPEIVDVATVIKPAEIDHALDPVEGCRSKEGLVINSVYLDNYSSQPMGIIVTNQGNNSVDYLNVDFDDGSPVVGHLPIIPFEDSKTRLLKPLGTVEFDRPPDLASGFRITFWYRLHNRKDWRYISAYFPDERSQAVRCAFERWRP